MENICENIKVNRLSAIHALSKCDYYHKFIIALAFLGTMYATMPTPRQK